MYTNGGRPLLTRNIAPGIHRLQHAYVNCYLLEDSDGVTIVDAALPATWPFLLQSLAAIGRAESDVRAIVLTHAHFDHLGFAARAMEEWGVPVYAHPEEEYLAAHPYQYAHENLRLLYPLRHPRGLVPLSAMAIVGALGVSGITGLRFYSPGDELDVPGHPSVVFSPGHTFGHCALLVREAGALLSGDALVTFDPYTGGYGAQIVSGAATADSSLALHSLGALAETRARIVLPGHGPAWRDGIETAVEDALWAGAS